MAERGGRAPRAHGEGGAHAPRTGVLGGMLLLARDHWGAFAVGVGLVVGSLAVLSHLVLGLVIGPIPGFVDMINDPQINRDLGLSPQSPDIPGLGVAVLLSTVAGLFLTPLAYGVAAHVAAAGYRTGRASAIASLRAAADRYAALVGAVVLQSLVPLVMIALPLLALAASAANEVIPLWIVSLVLALVGLVAAIIMVVRVSLAIPVIVVERLGPVRALRRSNALVKGRTGRAFLALLVIGILAEVMVVGLPLGVGAISGDAGTTVAAAGGAVTELLAKTVAFSLVAGALTSLYFNRRASTEDVAQPALAQAPGHTW